MATLLALTALVSTPLLTYADIVTVTSQSELEANLQSDTTILLGANINLESTIEIGGQNNLIIDGAGLYKVDGQGEVPCFVISDSSTEVTLQNLTITGGYSKVNGGGLSVSGGIVSLLSCEVVGNNAPYYSGGGAYIVSGTTYMHDTLFVDNSANYGGAVLFSGSTLDMEDCQILNNTADAYGGGMKISGGSSEITGCAFHGNKAVQSATASGGGALQIISGTTRLTDCTISSNTAALHGGGIYVQSEWPTVTLTSSKFESNAATDGVDVFLYQKPKLYVFSSCAANTFNSGQGTLQCESNTGSGNTACSAEYPADLSVGECSSCADDAPFACCGATECAATEHTCSTAETDACPGA